MKPQSSTQASNWQKQVPLLGPMRRQPGSAAGLPVWLEAAARKPGMCQARAVRSAASAVEALTTFAHSGEHTCHFEAGNPLETTYEAAASGNRRAQPRSPSATPSGFSSPHVFATAGRGSGRVRLHRYLPEGSARGAPLPAFERPTVTRDFRGVETGAAKPKSQRCCCTQTSAAAEGRSPSPRSTLRRRSTAVCCGRRAGTDDGEGVMPRSPVCSVVVRIRATEAESTEPLGHRGASSSSRLVRHWSTAVYGPHRSPLPGAGEGCEASIIGPGSGARLEEQPKRELRPVPIMLANLTQGRPHARAEGLWTAAFRRCGTCERWSPSGLKWASGSDNACARGEFTCVTSC